ncbi:hypothetical protein CALVIDRAFT_92966 [Calocera viscosa TUFC12733]|uniref:FCH-domain-containing protein n=1 Tax=Calocera viscosa (strain TUFC12733) TaxID=1330018 RepID=A0A167MVD8_CALVF|nr:hypothetical protein CALVIDRAFT_92966 [Calocera viscosa TUFC12733]
MATANQTYGASLPDQFHLISNHLLTHLSLIADTREMIRERAALEREYATKLRDISFKAVGKRAKRASSLVVGDEPSRAFNESTFKNHTFDSAFQVFLASIENTARDHITLADALDSEVVAGLALLEKRKDDLRKLEVKNYEKILEERDGIYDQRIKVLRRKYTLSIHEFSAPLMCMQYDDACITVENSRRKQELGKHSAEKFDSLTDDMNTTKNAYLVSIAISNREKDKYFEEDLPVYEDLLQDLQTSLTTRLTAILNGCTLLHLAHIQRITTHQAANKKALESVNPANDQNLFIQYNQRPFSLPADWSFEPCASHYDTSDVSLDVQPKIYLQNRLASSRAKIANVKPEADAKQRDVTSLQRVLVKYRESPKTGDAEEVARQIAEASHQVAMLTTTVATLEAEIACVQAALGGDEGGGQPHSWKSSSFSIPTTCAYCDTSIWGLSKQGKTCKACGISVHNKCELKVPATCGDPNATIKKSEIVRSKSGTGTPASRTRASSNASVASNSSTPSLTTSISKTSSSIPEDRVSSAATTSSPASPGGAQQAKVAFTFQGSSSHELSVSEGETVTIVDPDDGTGWVEVRSAAGSSGLVPASYLKVLPPSNGAKKRGPAPPPPVARGTKKVKALFDYEAQTADELDLEEGKTYELAEGGDKDQGWWEIRGSGKKGLVPANYVELIK